MAAKDGITKKSKPSYLAVIKILTKWLGNPRRQKNELNEIIEKYDVEKLIIKRLLSYVYNYPHIIWYYNKYLNALYDFNKFDTADLIRSFSYLLDVNHRNASNKWFYLKSSELSDKNKQQVKTFFDEYFTKLFDKRYNDLELNFFYDLILNGILDNENIMRMSAHLTGGKEVITLEDFGFSKNDIDYNLQQDQPIILNTIALDIKRELPQNIKKFNDGIKAYIIDGKKECINCELKGKPCVFIDTNVENFTPVDIIFIGLNPGKDDIDNNKPFTSKLDMCLREQIAKLPSDVKWVIANILPCHTKSESDIKNIDNVVENCKDIINGIMSTFPSKYKVPLGAKAIKALGINGTVSNLAGKTFKQGETTILPMLSPKSTAYDQKNKIQFENDFKILLNAFKLQNTQSEIINTNINNNQIKTPKNKSLITIPDHKIINEVTSDLTFFDVKEINNQIIKIFIDKNGDKKYKIEPYELYFYIKTGDWKLCNQTTDFVDGIVSITGKEKPNIIKKIREKLENIKNLKG